ncbi:alpha/beta fold hydrolase [Clavibacter tessellarius]|uniref:alpha/beta fold hydrolase n=1 Tax=Clavibacter tessellarius TaxID=31965 RepID=UPI0039EC00A3
MSGGLLGRDVAVTTPDGRRLRAMIGGVGDDLVLLEAGLGGSGLTWALVHGILARSHRVVAYGRAGLGSSDPDPARRSEHMVPVTDPDVVAAVVAALP